MSDSVADGFVVEEVYFVDDAAGVLAGLVCGMDGALQSVGLERELGLHIKERLRVTVPKTALRQTDCGRIFQLGCFNPVHLLLFQPEVIIAGSRVFRSRPWLALSLRLELPMALAPRNRHLLKVLGIAQHLNVMLGG